MVDRDFTDHLQAVWSSLAELGADLDDHEWHLPTDCPGWTVKDQLAHMVGTEELLTGRETPASTDGPPPHVLNELGSFNEAWVEHYRRTPGPELLSRFVEVTDRRLTALRGMSDDELSAESRSPVGTMRYADFMRIRVLDCWVHEQDIRHATGRIGGLDGPVAETVVDKLLESLGYVVARRVRPPEGAVVTLRLHGPVPRVRTIEVSQGRGKAVDPSAAATCTVATDTTTFVRLATGRWTAEHAIEEGLVEFSHDGTLGRSLVAQLATTP